MRLLRCARKDRQCRARNDRKCRVCDTKCRVRHGEVIARRRSRRGNLVVRATISAMPQDCFVPSGDYLRGITLFFAMTVLIDGARKASPVGRLQASMARDARLVRLSTICVSVALPRTAERTPDVSIADSPCALPRVVLDAALARLRHFVCAAGARPDRARRGRDRRFQPLARGRPQGRPGATGQADRREGRS